MRFALVGPVHPYRGGIAHYTALLASALAERHDVRVFSFRRQYPRWLYPGESDRDTSSTLGGARPVRPGSLLPWTWRATAQSIQRFQPHLAVVQWWVLSWAPSLGSLAAAGPGRNAGHVQCHNVIPTSRARGIAWPCAGHWTPPRH